GRLRLGRLLLGRLLLGRLLLGRVRRDGLGLRPRELRQIRGRHETARRLRRLLLWRFLWRVRPRRFGRPPAWCTAATLTAGAGSAATTLVVLPLAVVLLLFFAGLLLLVLFLLRAGLVLTATGRLIAVLLRLVLLLFVGFLLRRVALDDRRGRDLDLAVLRDLSRGKALLLLVAELADLGLAVAALPHFDAAGAPSGRVRLH